MGQGRGRSGPVLRWESPTMKPRQEFLVIEAGGDVAVYAPRQFPLGTPIDRDAKRLGVSGSSLVTPPKVHFIATEFDQWRRQLEGAGYTVTLGPFWTDADMLAKSDEAIRRGETISLEDFRDELLRRVGGAGREEDQRLEPVEPPPT